MVGNDNLGDRGLHGFLLILQALAPRQEGDDIERIEDAHKPLLPHLTVLHHAQMRSPLPHGDPAFRGLPDRPDGRLHCVRLEELHQLGLPHPSRIAIAEPNPTISLTRGKTVRWNRRIIGGEAEGTQGAGGRRSESYKREWRRMRRRLMAVMGRMESMRRRRRREAMPMLRLSPRDLAIEDVGGRGGVKAHQR
ncbi:hypothetical protein CRG98_046132 [Punica granatum]|uniref:Uncharacterized protein n=1 Tax=Punica granatum TaxID=22663 RepID=A0A2I0HPJ4_PUNGR|nr:hypothetical protein CRG98_046132 [Punica granatum]